MKSCRVGIAVAVLACTTLAQAGAIIQDQVDGWNQIAIHSPIGQTFTAQDAHVQIGFAAMDMNPTFGPYEVGINLFEGSGVSGTLLASSPMQTLPDGFGGSAAGYFYVDFSAITLTPGTVYTAIATSTNVRPGIGYYQADVYSGGSLYQGQVYDDALEMWLPAGLMPEFDATFRVLPISDDDPAPTVPVPGALLLGGMGAGLVGWLRRQRAL